MQVHVTLFITVYQNIFIRTLQAVSGSIYPHPYGINWSISRTTLNRIGRYFDTVLVTVVWVLSCEERIFNLLYSFSVLDLNAWKMLQYGGGRTATPQPAGCHRRHHNLDMLSVAAVVSAHHPDTSQLTPLQPWTPSQMHNNSGSGPT